MTKDNLRELTILYQREIDHMMGKRNLWDSEKEQLELLKFEYELAGCPQLEDLEDVESICFYEVQQNITAEQARNKAQSIQNREIKSNSRVIAMLNECYREIKKAASRGMFVTRFRSNIQLSYEDKFIVFHELKKDGFLMEEKWPSDHCIVYEINWA